MPGSVSAGMPEKNASNAASPPADAPMPTMGKPACSWLNVSAFGDRFQICPPGACPPTDLSGGIETDVSCAVSTDASGGAASDIGIACFMGTVFFFFILFLLFNAGC
jgi:hypothetical protein